MTISRLPAAVAVAVAIALAPVGGHGANSRHPYRNVDRRNDAGNDTGDSQIERLNEGQLDQNYRGPWYYLNGQPAPPPGAASTMPPPGATFVSPPPPPGPPSR